MQEVSIETALAFADKLVGTTLCTGAGEDESAQYPTSPIVQAFLQGAVGPTVAHLSVYTRWGTGRKGELLGLGEFLEQCGKRLKGE